jgi:hypothetical protein
MCVVAEPLAVAVRSSHQFEEEIGAASSENGLFIAKMEFSVLTGSNIERNRVGKQNQKRTVRHIGGANPGAMILHVWEAMLAA